MPLKCPSCEARDVEKIALDSDEGKAIIYDLLKYQKVRLPKIYEMPSFKEERNNVFILCCKTCGLVEIVDFKRKESLVKTKLRKKRESGKGLAVGIAIGTICTLVGILVILWAEFYWVTLNILDSEGHPQSVDIKLLAGLPGFTNEVIVLIVVITAAAILLFILSSYALLKLIQKRIFILEFNFKLHRAMGDDKMYFFEYSSEREQVSFKASVVRSIYGAILVLGIGILVIENFFTIPDLRPYQWDAAYITVVAILIAFPLIIIYLYVSPIITKEVNLYAHNKKSRDTKNVGEWLDSALQLFAAVDILLTSIIIIDSNLGGYIIVILSLVLIVFAWILIFTTIFNNYYHAEFKLKFKEHLKQKYLLPIRQMRLAPQFYYCPSCGQLLDFIHDDKCSKCAEPIVKCMICGDVLVTSGYDHAHGKEGAGEQDRLIQLARKVERKLNKDDSDRVGELACPECGAMAHVDELYSWVSLRGTCPSCKKKISFGSPSVAGE
ncbi:MAG: hypothetical protein Q6353_011205 [Candidatus Sigynarchaeum springense]